MPSTPPIVDSITQLWHRFQGGDERALGELARQYYPSLYNYGIRLLTDPETVKDAIQDLFMELWRQRTALPEVQFVRTYLLKSLRYKLSRRRQRYWLLDTDDLFESQLPSQTCYETQCIEEEEQNQQLYQLNQLISALSRRQQEIIYLRFFQELDNAEIAQVMNIDKRSVANLVSKTLAQLRAQWLYSSLLLLSRLVFPL